MNVRVRISIDSGIGREVEIIEEASVFTGDTNTIFDLAHAAAYAARDAYASKVPTPRDSDSR